MDEKQIALSRRLVEVGWDSVLPVQEPFYTYVGTFHEGEWLPNLTDAATGGALLEEARTAWHVPSGDDDEDPPGQWLETSDNDGMRLRFRREARWGSLPIFDVDGTTLGEACARALLDSALAKRWDPTRTQTRTTPADQDRMDKPRDPHWVTYQHGPRVMLRLGSTLEGARAPGPTENPGLRWAVPAVIARSGSVCPCCGRPVGNDIILRACDVREATLFVVEQSGTSGRFLMVDVGNCHYAPNRDEFEEVGED